jgi:hypothetical protein
MRTYLKIDFVAKSSRMRPQGKKPRKRTVRTLRSFFPENEIRELCSTLQKNSDFEIGSSKTKRGKSPSNYF